MNRLIIITGISGSGKSTVAKEIYKRYKKSTLLSVDALKENIYELVGFYNYAQKQNLKKIVYRTFLELLEECMRRNDENIIVEYPFDKTWERKFKRLLKKYEYDAITIKVTGESYDILYERLKTRNNGKERHPGHSLMSYDPKKKDEYNSTNELKYEELKKDYESNKYTSLDIGEIINFINENSNYDDLFSLIN